MKKTWIEAVTYNTDPVNLIDKIVLDWTEREHKIHGADPSYWDWDLMMMIQMVVEIMKRNNFKLIQKEN